MTVERRFSLGSLTSPLDFLNKFTSNPDLGADALPTPAIARSPNDS